ncbi:peptidase [Bacteroidia bacterium]|nr:peptidase [Bacteroidia bacterium]
MAKKAKFIFDPHSLSVVRVKKNVKDILKKILFYFALALVIFVMAVLVSFYFIDSPKTQNLVRQLEQMERNFSQMNEQIDLLSNVVEDMRNRDNNLYRMVFEAEPHKDDMVFFGNQLYTDYTKVDSKTIIATAKKIDELSNKIYSESKSMDEIYQMAKSKQERLKCMPAILPINKKLGKVYSGFGMRLHPVFRSYRMHTGIDLVAPKGTAIYATGDGVVEVAGNAQGYGGYGVSVKINHGFGYASLYAHCSQVAVKVGQKVKRGDVIAYVGNTGTSTGSHCHYEVIVNGKQVNPVYYFFNDLTPEEYEKILEKSKEINQALS